MGNEQIILIVDDEERNVRLLQAMLSREDYRILTATSGEEALELVSDSEPDLILLDVMMPGMDGFEVCKRIKHQAETRFIPVLMVTALTENEDRIRAMKAGADDFLSKPVDQTELFLRVKSLLRIKQYHDSLRKSHDKIARQHEQLSNLEKFKEDLTHMLVHDLNNPLFSLNMALETLILDREELSENQVKMLTDCVDNCRELRDLIRDILDIHKIEEDELKIKSELTDLVDLVKSAASLFIRKMEAKQITLTFDAGCSESAVHADPGIMKRVVANLLGNAVRHTPVGGNIEITVTSNEAGILTVRVKDSGDGIPPEFHEKIFDKFQQVEVKKTSVAAGLSGLGLPFCKIAVQAHGGTIWVESDGEGKGSTFAFTLPALAAAAKSK